MKLMLEALHLLQRRWERLDQESSFQLARRRLGVACEVDSAIQGPCQRPLSKGPGKGGSFPGWNHRKTQIERPTQASLRMASRIRHHEKLHVWSLRSSAFVGVLPT